MKPILFNQEMVRAILDGRKTVTRRNPFRFEMKDGYNPEWSGYSLGEYYTGRIETGVCLYSRGAHDVWGVRSNVVKPKYQVGDILYVRETFADTWTPSEDTGYVYKADGIPSSFPYWGNASTCKDKVWRPPLHMPKEAARIFLKVTDVRVERLQDITEEQAKKEGAASITTPNIQGKGRTYIQGFGELWNSTVKEYWQKFESNPWAWVISFERISKEEAYVQQ